jgi:hypothetical protein
MNNESILYYRREEEMNGDYNAVLCYVTREDILVQGERIMV